MVPVRVTLRRVLWLAGACLLLLPALTGAEPGSGRHGDPVRASHVSCHAHTGPAAHRQPARKVLDDNDNDADSDDLIGDSWLAPCALPQRGAFQAFIRGSLQQRQPYRSPAIRSFSVIDPFAPRPPPVRS